MDTSKEYIKMCEKAVEIQKLWKPKTGDVLCHKNTGDILWVDRFNQNNIFVCDHLSSVYTSKQGSIWLPRQDQLQGMVENKRDFGIGHNVNLFHNFVFSKYSVDYRANDIFISMEQLWLAFVMKEKYQKVWDGEDWRSQEHNQ